MLPTLQSLDDTAVHVLVGPPHTLHLSSNTKEFGLCFLEDGTLSLKSDVLPPQATVHKATVAMEFERVVQ